MSAQENRRSYPPFDYSYFKGIRWIKHNYNTEYLYRSIYEMHYNQNLDVAVICKELKITRAIFVRINRELVEFIKEFHESNVRINLKSKVNDKHQRESYKDFFITLPDDPETVGDHRKDSEYFINPSFTTIKLQSQAWN